MTDVKSSNQEVAPRPWHLWKAGERSELPHIADANGNVVARAEGNIWIWQDFIAPVIIAAVNGASIEKAHLARYKQALTRANGFLIMNNLEPVKLEYSSVETDGLPVTQEPKYTVRNGRLVNRATGEPIPDDEPLFVFRAKDRAAVYAIMHYRSECLRNPDHYQAVDARVGDFLRFAEQHPDRMKWPDTSPLEPSACPKCDAVRKLGLTSCFEHKKPQKASCEYGCLLNDDDTPMSVDPRCPRHGTDEDPSAHGQQPISAK